MEGVKNEELAIHVPENWAFDFCAMIKRQNNAICVQICFISLGFELKNLIQAHRNTGRISCLSKDWKRFSGYQNEKNFSGQQNDNWRFNL